MIPLVARPTMAPSYAGENRLLRDRLGALDASVDRSRLRPADAAARLLVQVYDGGSMPTANDHYFACYPVDMGGMETEGGTGTPYVDTTKTVFVDVLGSQVPVAGDFLTAYAVGGRWVAERGNFSPKCPCAGCAGESLDTFPTEIDVVLSCNGVSYALTLNGNNACGFLGQKVVTVPANGPCSSIDVLLQGSLEYGLATNIFYPLSGWIFAFTFNAVINTSSPALGCAAPGTCDLYCLIPGTNTDAYCSLGWITPVITLPECPVMPYSKTVNVSSYLSITDQYLMQLFFGVACQDGNWPLPFEPVMATLTGEIKGSGFQGVPCCGGCPCSMEFSDYTVSYSGSLGTGTGTLARSGCVWTSCIQDKSGKPLVSFSIDSSSIGCTKVISSSYCIPPCGVCSIPNPLTLSWMSPTLGNGNVQMSPAFNAAGEISAWNAAFGIDAMAAQLTCSNGEPVLTLSGWTATDDTCTPAAATAQCSDPFVYTWTNFNSCVSSDGGGDGLLSQFTEITITGPDGPTNFTYFNDSPFGCSGYGATTDNWLTLTHKDCSALKLAYENITSGDTFTVIGPPGSSGDNCDCGCGLPATLSVSSDTFGDHTLTQFAPQIWQSETFNYTSTGCNVGPDCECDGQEVELRFKLFWTGPRGNCVLIICGGLDTAGNCGILDCPGSDPDTDTCCSYTGGDGTTLSCSPLNMTFMAPQNSEIAGCAYLLFCNNGDTATVTA